MSSFGKFLKENWAWWVVPIVVVVGLVVYIAVTDDSGGADTPFQYDLF